LSRTTVFFGGDTYSRFSNGRWGTYKMIQETITAAHNLQIPEDLIVRNIPNKHLGVHFIAEFWEGKIIEDQKEVERILMQAAKKARSTTISVASHKFSPHGITAFVLLAESHLSLHSWPEKNYLAIDVFTCGHKTQPQKALEYLKEVYQPKRVEVREIKRGKVR